GHGGGRSLSRPQSIGELPVAAKGPGRSRRPDPAGATLLQWRSAQLQRRRAAVPVEFHRQSGRLHGGAILPARRRRRPQRPKGVLQLMKQAIVALLLVLLALPASAR